MFSCAHFFSAAARPYGRWRASVAQPFRAAGSAIGIGVAAVSLSAQQKYDLLLKGGHVIDARNNLSAVRDVAIAGGKVAAVAANLNAADALKVVDASGLYVTPGLVDIHVHVFAGTGERGSYA